MVSIAGAWLNLNLNSEVHLCRRSRSIQTAKKRLMSSPCEIIGEYMSSSDYDWKTNKLKREWPYKGDAPDDPEYIKDKKKLFNENGNGWWIKPDRVEKQ